MLLKRCIRISHPYIPPSRNTPINERLALTQRIDGKVLPAAMRVCQRTFRNPENCISTLVKRTLTVVAKDDDVNASVGGKYDLTVLGGLVAQAGTDGEIASVLSHEYAHALMGHVAKSKKNAWGGLLLGTVAVIGLGAATGDPSILVDLGSAATNIGVQMGALAYSKKMELEADHLGMFILHDAEYDVREASTFFLRMQRAQQHRSTNGDKRIFGIFNTHPPHKKRVEQLVATERLIDAGARRPIWKKELEKAKLKKK